MKIYTKTGDKGETSLFGGRRITKANIRIESYGNVDELNSSLGLVRSFINSSKVNCKLEREQKNLLRLGADLATPFDSDKKFQNNVNRINKEDIDLLENEIDLWEAKLPKLTNFILPGGSKEASFTHLARSICRRAERSVVKLSNEEEINRETMVYLNRLSDWLFVLARILS